MQRIKKIVALLLSVMIMSGFCVFGAGISADAAGTGAGLAEWALNAYYSNWAYVYGGSTAGAVDCSGLIYSYCGGARTASAQLNASSVSGSVSNGIPRVHGLGLWQPGHAGVYIGDGMAVDARNESSGVCYSSVGYMKWTYWFKVAACTYITNGWESFNGSYYYYENGEYIVSTSRTIDGVTYTFDSTGASDKTPTNMSSTASSTASSSSSTGSSQADSASTAGASEKYPVYQLGSNGDEVTKIQERLSELGYYNGEISGYFGEVTEEAYIAFQTAAGLYVDGISGSDRETLYSDSAPYAPENTVVEEAAETEEEEAEAEAAEPEAVTEEEETEDSGYRINDEGDGVLSIQQRLSELGYFDIETSGCFGEYTEQAVKNFQLANNLWATGVVDDDTWEILFSDGAVVNAAAEEAAYSNDTATADTADMGPYPMSGASASRYVLENEINQGYADTAVEVVKQTNTVTKKALSDSAETLPRAVSLETQRNINIGLWFGLVAAILVVCGVTFFAVGKKSGRYIRYIKNPKRRVKAIRAKTNSDITYW